MSPPDEKALRAAWNLVLTGRVAEAEQMVKALRGQGGTVWYLMAKDEGHGFRKKQNRDFYLWTVALFLERLRQGQ